MGKFFVLSAGALLGSIFVASPIGSGILYLTLIFLIFIFLNPKYILFLSAAFLPLNNIILYYEDIQFSFYYFFISLFFSIWLLHKALKIGKVDKIHSMLTVLTVFFVFWSGISLSWSLSFNFGLYAFAELFLSVMIFLLMPYFIKTYDDLRQFLRFLIFIGLILGIMVFISQWYTVNWTVVPFEDIKINFALLNEKNRPAGFTGVNNAATILNFLIFICIAYLFMEEGRIKWQTSLAILVIFFLMTVVVMTGSKSGFGGLVAGFIFLFATQALKGRRIIYAFLTAASLLLAYLTAMSITTGDVTTSRVTEVGAGFSFETRFTWWSKGLKALLNSYGVGVGSGGMKEIIDPTLFTHNIYLSVLFELGIVGFAIFTLLLINSFVIFRSTLKGCQDSRLRGVVFCMMAAMVGFLLNNTLQGEYYNRVLWMMLGIDLAILQIIISKEPPAAVFNQDSKALWKA